MKLDNYFAKRFLFSATLFLIAVIASYYSSVYIEKTFYNPLVVRDLLWDKILIITLFL